jgi:mono/diheme cytochrome c family protein
MRAALRSPTSFIAALLLGAFAMGCASSAGAPAPTASDPSPQANEGARIASIHRSKCGACHTPVEPGTRSRPVIESALKRHRVRAKLSERDWAELVDYLAADGGANGRNAAFAP